MLQNHIDVPFALKAIEKFVFAQILEVKICRIGNGRECEFDYGWMFGVVETAMGGREEIGTGSARQRLNEVKEGCKAKLRDVASVEVIERFWIGWRRFEWEIGECADRSKIWWDGAGSRCHR